MVPVLERSSRQARAKVVLGRTRVFFWVMYKMTDGMGRAPVLEHRSRQVLCGGGEEKKRRG